MKTINFFKVLMLVGLFTFNYVGAQETAQLTTKKQLW